MPLPTETGAGEEVLKSAAKTAGTSAGNEGSAGRSARSSAGGGVLEAVPLPVRSAGSSAVACIALVPALLPALLRHSPRSRH